MRNVNTDEISVKDLIRKVRSIISYLKSKWIIISICGILGGILGFIYAACLKPTYTASSTFVLDDGSKAGGVSQYAGLASMAGIDLGGNGNGGMFQSDNILELYKSRLMIEKALLSQADFNGKRQLLIERYIEFKGLRTIWKKKDHISDISFAGNPQHFNRIQDSIITEFVNLFNKKLLTVAKLDKKTSIIKVDVVDTDELFARAFNITLVENVNRFYSETKTKKSIQSIQILQRQADSVRNALNNSINGVASAMDAAPNANPSLQILRAPSQRKQVDVQASNAIYGEIVKNLELAKMSLRQETPLIQIIDGPVLPLVRTKTGKVTTAIIGLFLGTFIISLTLISINVFKTQVK